MECEDRENSMFFGDFMSISLKFIDFSLLKSNVSVFDLALSYSLYIGGSRREISSCL